VRFLIFAHSGCDETNSQLEMLMKLYPDIEEFKELIEPYKNLGGKINKFIQYVESNWRT
jgi:four helix bundle protein